MDGETSQQYNNLTGTVTTIFDSNKFSEATDLSVAQTILHEAIHAYLIAYFHVQPFLATKTYSELVDDIAKAKYPNQNAAQHAEFVRDFVNDIGSALSEFGNNQGYNISDQYYNELAWSGLTTWPRRDSEGNIIKDSNGNTVYEDTAWFKDKYPDVNDRNRIKNEILTELGARNANNQKGKSSGC